MSLLVDWLRMPVLFFAGLLRLLSILALIATLGGLLMQRSESRFICFVVLPIASLVFYAISAQLSRLAIPSRPSKK